MAPKTLLQLKQQRQAMMSEREKLAAVSADSGKSQAAIEAAALAKKSFAGGKAGKVEALKEQANLCFRAQDYPKALELYNQAILLDGKNAVLHSNRSAVYCALRQFPLALKDADACLRLAPGYGRGHFRRGYALEQQWRYAEAFDAYSLGLKLTEHRGHGHGHGHGGGGADPLLVAAHAELKQLLSELRMTGQSAKAAAAAADQEKEKEKEKDGAEKKSGSCSPV